MQQCAVYVTPTLHYASQRRPAFYANPFPRTSLFARAPLSAKYRLKILLYANGWWLTRFSFPSSPTALRKETVDVIAISVYTFSRQYTPIYDKMLRVTYDNQFCAYYCCVLRADLPTVKSETSFLIIIIWIRVPRIFVVKNLKVRNKTNTLKKYGSQTGLETSKTKRLDLELCDIINITVRIGKKANLEDGS